MIQRTEIDGRPATVAEYHGMAKIMFDDGEVVFGLPADAPMVRADFDPSEPRDEDGKWTAGGGAGRKYTRDELMKMPIDDLDKMAFGHHEGEKLTVQPDEVTLKYPGDLENPEDKFKKGGMAWAKSVDFSEPVEFSIGHRGELQLEDGHHRYFAAKKLGKKLTGVITKVEGKPIEVILGRQGDPPETGMHPVKPEAFVEARDKSTRSQFLSAHPASELGEHTLLTNTDGTVGISVDKHGDIQNVFNNGGPKGGAHKAMVAAIAAGGRTLDCYDNYLPGLYHQFGFEEDSRMKFNPEFAPAGWDFDKLGMPDIVFMSWRGYKPGGAQGALDRMAGHHGKWPAPERSKVYGDDWDAAKQASRDAAAHAGGADDHRLHAAVQGGDPADRAGDQPRAGAGEGGGRPVTSTPAFRAWFRNSKVVDDKGEPLVVYKGMHPYDYTKETKGDLGPEITSINRPTAFPAFNKGEKEPEVHLAGFFGSKETANKFVFGEHSSIFPVYLSLQKPYVIDAKGAPAGHSQFGPEGKPFRDAIRSGRYDGVIIRNTKDEGDVYVALDPHQIKSAIGNKGTFDPSSAAITDSMFAADAFDPAEPRDEGGKWTAGAGSAGKGDLGEYTASYSGAKGQYDKRYFKVEKDELKDDDGTVVGTKEKTVPIRPIRSQVPAEPQEGVIFRGMSGDEFDTAMKSGRIKSAGDYNMSSQQGLTYYSTDPKSAGSYASSFAPAKHKPTFDRPAYVVAVKRPADNKITHVQGTAEDEIGVNSHIPNTDILAVYRGNVIATGLVGPELHWEKIEMPTAQRQIETKAFKDWFGDSKIVDDEGKPQVMYHGTLGDFDSFDKAKASTEGDWGAGFYFTNDPEDLSHNYAGHGPDITNRIENLAETIEQDDEFEGDHESAKAEAARQLDLKNEGAAMPVFLKMDNPFKVGGKDETYLDGELPYDEEADEYGEPTGKAWDLVAELKKLSEDEDYFDRKDIAKFADSLTEHMLDGGIRASELEDLARKSEDLAYVTDENGKLVAHDILRKALQNIGFDGIIDTKVSHKFPNMEGMKPTTTHYIAFEPTQIKSAIGNKGTFDPKSTIITDSAADDAPMRELQIVPPLQIAPSGGIPPAYMQDRAP